MPNPIIANVFRGRTVESIHRGAFAVVGSAGEIVLQTGDIETPVFPRSAIKAFQCLPLIESGAAAHFGLNDEEIALCCSSHNGEAEHVRVARSILAKCGCNEDCYECGAHMPGSKDATFDLVRQGKLPEQVHNFCSGKHAGMIALAKHLGAPIQNYSKIEHPVQQKVAETLGQYCAVDISKASVGIDGCSVPSWAIPLRNIGLGFAKLSEEKNTSAAWIIKAVRSHPFLVAGTNRFDTNIMQAVPRLFIKLGAEGLFCGVIAHAGLGFALKCDDGAYRGAEVAAALMLSKLDVWTEEEKQALLKFATEPMFNWRKIHVGGVVATP
jgi:L-asparaginase II